MADELFQLYGSGRLSINVCIFSLLFFKVSGETKGNNTCPAPCQSALKINEKCEVSSELLRFNVISFRKIQSQKNTRPHLACSISRYYLSKEFIWQSGFNILLINRLALEKNQHITENSSKLLKKLNVPVSWFFFQGNVKKSKKHWTSDQQPNC